MRGGNLKLKKAGGGPGGRAQRFPPNAFSSRQSLLLLLLLLLLVVVVVVKIHAHFPHGCGTHFTVHTYFYTLAQGVKGCTRVESKLHVLTSGLSAVSDC